MRNYATALFVAIAGLAALSASASAAPSFVGIWYSAGQPDEPGVMSLIEFSADGTFREEFRKCVDGMVEGYQFQSGTWTFENGIERTITIMIDGDATNVEDSYTVELLTDTQRRIRLESKALSFVSIRVNDFSFPDCASGM